MRLTEDPAAARRAVLDPDAIAARQRFAVAERSPAEDPYFVAIRWVGSSVPFVYLRSGMAYRVLVATSDSHETSELTPAQTQFLLDLHDARTQADAPELRNLRERALDPTSDWRRNYRALAQHFGFTLPDRAGPERLRWHAVYAMEATRLGSRPVPANELRPAGELAIPGGGRVELLSNGEIIVAGASEGIDIFDPLLLTPREVVLLRWLVNIPDGIATELTGHPRSLALRRLARPETTLEPRVSAIGLMLRGVDTPAAHEALAAMPPLEQEPFDPRPRQR